MYFQINIYSIKDIKGCSKLLQISDNIRKKTKKLYYISLKMWNNYCPSVYDFFAKICTYSPLHACNEPAALYHIHININIYIYIININCTLIIDCRIKIKYVLEKR